MKTNKSKDMKPSLDREVQARVATEPAKMSLAELRHELGMTQLELAAAAQMTQGQISSLEHRTDHLVSTLRRWVRALGGDIEVVAVLEDKRVKLNV